MKNKKIIVQKSVHVYLMKKNKNSSENCFSFDFTVT